jgi:superfamily II DNA or RNA helicase
MNQAVSLWPSQEYALAEVPRRILAGERKICLTSPTGGGKTLILCGLVEWALEHRFKVVLYTNRKLLISQLVGVLEGQGISFGVRAANYQDQRELRVQISSLPTERSRVLNSDKWNKWEVHGHGERVLALVDEAHLNASNTAQTVLGRHIDDGGAYVGVTATPIDLGHLYDTLVVAGTPSELRQCGALVPAYHYGPDEPDMRDFKQNVKTGEYSEGDVRKAIMTKCIFARVLEYYHRLNPDQRPTILFGPGVKESIWFAEQLTAAGIRTAHIDGEGVWLDGEYERGTNREEILRMTRNGDIKVLCNRFVLREGLDLPEVSHLIIATVFGGLRSYLQALGRGLRACSGKDRCVVQDHGGHWWRHGSVNMDRQWNLCSTENMIAGMRAERLRDKKETEPICCAQCGMIRKSGSICPQCNFESSKRSRMVMQRDGTLREHTGDIFKPRRIKELPNTSKIWTQCYYRAKNSRNRMTFNQAEALFFLENYYYPPRSMPLMPVNPMDWYASVVDVPRERLRA